MPKSVEKVTIWATTMCTADKEVPEASNTFQKVAVLIARDRLYPLSRRALAVGSLPPINCPSDSTRSPMTTPTSI